MIFAENSLRMAKVLNFFCTLILVTYRCYVSEQCGNNPPAVSIITFSINDGDRVCCNGTFASWDVSSLGLGISRCIVCPGMCHDCT